MAGKPKYVFIPKGVAGIYKITIRTLEEGKSYYYIGQSRDCAGRCRNHLLSAKKGKHHNRKLQAVFDKHQNMEFELVEECSLDIIHERELFHLKAIWGEKLCMNASLDVETPSRGLKRSPEYCRKLSEARSGEKHPNWGKNCPEETKKKIKEAQIGIPKSEEIKAKMRKPKKEGFKEMRREMMLGTKQKPEDVEKRAAKLRGVPRSEEYKAALKLKLNSPEVKEKARQTRALRKLEKEAKLNDSSR